MKIFIIQETDWLKRNPHQQHHLAEMMTLKGHEVLAIDYEFSWKAVKTKALYSRRKEFPGIAKIHKEAPVRLIRPAFVKIPVLDYVSVWITHAAEIRRQLAEFRPDVIVGFGILSSYTATLLTARTRTPFIYYWIDVLHLMLSNWLFRSLGKIIESAALRHADWVITINEKLKDTVISLGAPEKRTNVLRAGIDTGAFNPAVKGNAVRKRYGFKQQDVVLFFMGFLYHFSGLKEVILKLAESGISTLKLLIIGTGDAHDTLQEIILARGIQDRVILAGSKPYKEVPEYIAAADICLLPADPGEPIMQNIVPIKLYEYMAMGKPVIATRLPGVMKEFGADNGVIYVNRPEDVITRAMDLTWNGSLNELGAKARQFVQEKSWNHIADEFERILKEAIQEKNGGHSKSLRR